MRTLMRSRLAELTQIPPSELDGILRARAPKRDDPPPDAFAGLEPSAPPGDYEDMPPPDLVPDELLDRPPVRASRPSMRNAAGASVEGRHGGHAAHAGRR